MGLHLREVARTYGKGDNAFQALKPTSFGINPGTTVAIVGKSGSGKSTLLHLLVGLDHPSSGEVLFNGKNILKDYKTDLWRGENVGIVFQQFFLQPKDTVLENVALPLKIRGVKKKQRIKQASEALELVGLSDKAKNKANDLSGGQKQRVAIARAIVTKPAVLVADEPTGNLDSENGIAVEDLLFDLNKQLGTTLILVTHDDDLAARCQRVIRLRDGMVVHDSLARSQAAANKPAAAQPSSPVTAQQPARPRPLQPTAVPMPAKPKPLNRPQLSRPMKAPHGIPVIGGKSIFKPTPAKPRPVTVRPVITEEAKPLPPTPTTTPTDQPINQSVRRKIL